MAEVTNEDIMKRLDEIDNNFIQLAKNQMAICDMIKNHTDDSKTQFESIEKKQKSISKDVNDIFGAIDSATNTITSYIG